jgi:ribosomal protein L7/L12
MKKLVRIKLIENCPNKLQFVKLIKECSGLGLKEYKDICDRLHAGEIQTFEAREDDAVNYLARG